MEASTVLPFGCHISKLQLLGTLSRDYNNARKERDQEMELTIFEGIRDNFYLFRLSNTPELSRS